MGAAAKSNPLTGAIQSEYEFNKEQAKRAEADAVYNAGQRRKAAELLMKEQVANYGASGVELEGTPMTIIEQDRKNAELEAMNIIYAGKTQASIMKYQAKMNRFNGYMSLAKDGASMAISAGAFKPGAPKGGAPAGGSSTPSSGSAPSSPTLANTGKQ
jgi:hypothetical protein